MESYKTIEKQELKNIKEKADFIESVLNDVMDGDVDYDAIKRALIKCDYIKDTASSRLKD